MKRERIEKLLLQVIGHYVQRNISLVASGPFVSVTAVKVAPSLDLVRVHMSFLGAEKLDKGALLGQLMREHHWKIKRYVAEKLGCRLRRVPREIRFYLDERTEKGAQLMLLLKKL